MPGWSSKQKDESTQKGIRRQAMVHVDCRATSDRTAQVSVSPPRPPSNFWLQAACSRHSADRTVSTSKDGLDAVTRLANKKPFKRAKSAANPAKTSGTLT